MSASPHPTHLVLIPSYNPGPAVYATVRAARAHWNPVWVVVDGSRDGTAEGLQAMAADDPGLRVLVLPENRGKGAAVLHGLDEAARCGFTHALAISAGPAVRVNSISPGWVGTTAWQAPSRRHEPEYSAIDHAQHPVGRVGRPEDIGALAVYLLSSLSGFSTGQDFIVDGGMTRKMIYAE